MSEKLTEATDLEKLIFEKIGLYIQSGKATEVADNYYKPKLEEKQRELKAWVGAYDKLKAENEALKGGILSILSIIPNETTPLVHSIRYRAEELLKTKKG